MIGSLRRRILIAHCRKKRIWAAALCTASFITGQTLFGDETQPQQTRISQYLQVQYRASKKAEEAPAQEPVHVIARPLPLEYRVTDEENLPPIIPASAMPRPRPKNRQPGMPAQPSNSPGHAPAATATAKNPLSQSPPLRINLSGKPLPSIFAGQPAGTGLSSDRGPFESELSETFAPRQSPWNSQPGGAAAQSAGTIENPFVSQRMHFPTPRATLAMPPALFQSQLPPPPPSSTARTVGQEVSPAPAPYPMPLEILNPNVTKRSVALTGSNEPVPGVRTAAPALAMRNGQIPGESNPLRPAVKVALAESQPATPGLSARYDEPELLAAPASKEGERMESQPVSRRRIDALPGVTSEPKGASMAAERDGQPSKQKSSRRRYMAER